jgi:hypothetical protein
MTFEMIVKTGINPALQLLPKSMDTPEARVMLLAIGLQESRFKHRAQIVNGGGKGPARGYWQFERGSKASRGGIWGLYLHRSSSGYLSDLCKERDCAFDPFAIWGRIENDDTLAAGCARLMLYTHPKPLPKLGASNDAWIYYLELWRPGKPHQSSWPALYAQALDAVTG